MYDSRDDLYVPVMADESGYSYQMPPTSLSKNSKTAENFYQGQIIGASSFTQANQNTADITLESLLEHSNVAQSDTCRNFVSSALDSNRDELLNGLQAMKDRVNSLENQRTKTIFNLRKATDTYTKLLRQTPVQKISFSSQTEVDNGDLFEDTDIRAVYDRLELHLKDIETKKRLHNTHSAQELHRSSSGLLNHGSNGSLSDIEKTRDAVVSNVKFITDLHHLDTIPVLDVDHDGKFKQKSDAYKFKPIPPSDVMSSGSSRSLKLTEKQREKLTSYSDKLRTSQIMPAASSSPIPRREYTSTNKSIQCDVCHLEKSTQCACYSNAYRTEKWAQTSFPRKENGLVSNRAIESNNDLNYEKLRHSLLKMRQDAKERNLLKSEKDFNEIIKRPASAPESPIRKLQKYELFVDDKKPTFVAGKPSVTSHSLVVNLQELLATLKRQNPALYQIALKLGGQVSLTAMAEAFEQELKKLKFASETSLIQKLKEFDELTIEIQNCRESDPRQNELKQRHNKLVSELEQTDTYIQRLNGQSASLVRLTKKAQALMSAKNHRRCDEFRSRAVSVGSSNDASTGLSKHTVASREKASSMKKHSKPSNHKHSIQALKDIKLAKDVLNAN